MRLVTRGKSIKNLSACSHPVIKCCYKHEHARDLLRSLHPLTLTQISVALSFFQPHTPAQRNMDFVLQKLFRIIDKICIGRATVLLSFFFFFLNSTPIRRNRFFQTLPSVLQSKIGEAPVCTLAVTVTCNIKSGRFQARQCRQKWGAMWLNESAGNQQHTVSYPYRIQPKWVQN